MTLMHKRNKHSDRYDFQQLCESEPELLKYIIKNKFNNEETIDFSDSESVILLNSALLKSFYKIKFWNIPKGYLCPPIPGRADYLHYVADCLNQTNFNSKIKILDIGVGANCIYPIIGNAEYGWCFVGSDIDSKAVSSANEIVKNNNLEKFIEIRLQAIKEQILRGIIKKNDHFDFVICNPPFHASKKAAEEGSLRKSRNLKTKKALNFGGTSNELWCIGGEAEFIRKFVIESKEFALQCSWFSSLVSSKENLSGIYGELKRIGVKNINTFEMRQGQKISRFVAWSFKD